MSDIRDNLFKNIPDKLPEELADQLAEGRKFRLVRIVSKGHSTDWYDQEENEWVVLLTGEAELEFEQDEKKVKLQPGDYLLIPAHSRHRVSWTNPQNETIWLALYFTS